MVVACAAAAVGAPAAMAATGSHDATRTAPVTADAPGTTKDTTHHLVLGPVTGDPTRLLFDDNISPIDPLPAASDLDPGCLVEGTSLGTATCPASPVAITLGPGDDTLELQDGVDNANIDASAGNDLLDLHARNGAATVNLATVASTAAPNGLTFAGFENVIGGAGGDTLTGDAGGNVEKGGPGNDTLDGGAGNDALAGGDGSDDLIGGTGVNQLTGGDGVDTLTAGDSGDLLDGGPGKDTLTGGAGNDYIVAADGVVDAPIDCGAGLNDTVVADLGPAGPVDTFTGCENVQGTVRANPTRPPADSGSTTTEVVQPVIFLPALGTPPLTQVLAPGKANIADLTPPGAAMRTFNRQRISAALGRGVRVRVTCKEACGISVALSVDRATAKRLKLDTRTSPVVIGTATATRIVAGNTVLRVKVAKKVKAALKSSTRNVTTNFQVLVSDASGNGTLLSRRVTLVR